jgi:2-oxoisovalerate dehydrogenase E1 component
MSVSLETIYRSMITSRLVDDKMAKLVKQNLGGTFQLSAAGHEMISSVCGHALRSGVDWALPYYRDQPLALALGTTLLDTFAIFLGRKADHHSRGRMMPYHFSHKELRMPTQSSVVASQFLPAVGVAQGIKLEGKDEVVYVSGGDGATSEGDFHEALNYAGLHKLPVIFLIADNGWAISVPVAEQTAGGSVVEAFRNRPGVAIADINGCDYEACTRTVEEAVRRARAGEGPSAIFARVPRLAAHSNSDDPRKYRTTGEEASESERDPILRFEEELVGKHGWTREKLETIRSEIRDEIENAAKEAQEIPFPELESAGEWVFAPYDVAESEIGPTGESVVMVDAINHALAEEMERDSSVVVFGEDVAYGKGGVFGVTRGLTDQFGVERCFNTPLAESTIVGVALGLSLDGYHKPVAEIQFADYLWPAFDQVASEVSSICYRSGGEWNVPLVLRMPCGGYIQGGPYHSQSIEGILANIPGLKIAIPSNAADAKGLLKAAIRDPNPVIFLEHKGLYRQAKFCARSEPSADYILPFGKANIVREGKDLTLVGWGMTVVMGIEVCAKLVQEGIDIELIDLRTIVPADIETVIRSVQKTGKLLVAHEAWRNCGFGAEVAAQIAEKAFEYLDAPVMRCCGLDAAIPYSKPLENAVLPQLDDLLRATRELASY